MPKCKQIFSEIWLVVPELGAFKHPCQPSNRQHSSKTVLVSYAFLLFNVGVTCIVPTEISLNLRQIYIESFAGWFKTLFYLKGKLSLKNISQIQNATP